VSDRTTDVPDDAMPDDADAQAYAGPHGPGREPGALATGNPGGRP
jgi:hypothetical protein